MNWQTFGRSSFSLIKALQHQIPDNMLVRTAVVPANTQTVCLVSITARIDLPPGVNEVKQNCCKLQSISKLNTQSNLLTSTL
jgi:hypothetical protein